MVKKKETTSLEVVPQVQNNINMNLNQSDILDVAIQTRLEQLAPIEDSLRSTLKDLDDVYKKTVKELFLSSLDKEKKSFLDLGKKLGLVHVSTTEYSTDYSYARSIVSKTYNSVPYLENYKNPLTEFRRKKNENTVQSTYPQTLICRFVLKKSENDKVGTLCLMSDLFRINLSKEIITKWVSLTKTYHTQIVILNNELYEVVKETLELTYDERKIKARLTKAALSKSTEGKQILSMLEEATKIKLLS